MQPAEIRIAMPRHVMMTSMPRGKPKSSDSFLGGADKIRDIAGTADYPARVWVDTHLSLFGF